MVFFYGYCTCVSVSADVQQRKTDSIQRLKRVEVVEDDQGDIMEAVRKMSANYDFVVTSGGIGPTQVS